MNDILEVTSFHQAVALDWKSLIDDNENQSLQQVAYKCWRQKIIGGFKSNASWWYTQLTKMVQYYGVI